MMSVPGPSCRLSVQGVNPPVCCVLDDVCKGQFCGFTQCAVSSRGGGPRHIGTGTSLTSFEMFLYAFVILLNFSIFLNVYI